jgi:hypothetical protein
VCIEGSPCSSKIKLSVKKGNKCHYCDGLRSELLNAQLEILSYEKLIKVLQEELHKMEPHPQPNCRKQRNYHDEQLQSHKSQDDWIQVHQI